MIFSSLHGLFYRVSGLTILSTDLHQVWVKVKPAGDIVWFIGGWNQLLWFLLHHDWPNELNPSLKC